MIRTRYAFLLATLASATAPANWSVVMLHPGGGATISEAFGGYGGRQVGNAYYGDNDIRAILWNKTAASAISLQPAGSDSSIAYAATETYQAGRARIGGQTHAGMWFGTAASWVDLHPAGATYSTANGAHGNLQGGQAVIGGVQHAGIWSGTAGSWVDLHPAGATSSVIFGVFGSKQFGQTTVGGVINASLWSSTAGSWTSLHPAGADSSTASCGTNSRQGGYARFGNTFKAAIWSGSAASYVSLHPAGASGSSVSGINGNVQFGYRVVDGHYRACMWTGTVASLEDLHYAVPAQYPDSLAHCLVSDGINEYIIGTVADDQGNSFAMMWVRPLTAAFGFELNKTTVAGQNYVQGTVSLSTTRTLDTTFMTYDNSSLVTTPPTVTLPAGALSKNFQISVTAVTSPINTTLYCRLGSSTQLKPLTLAPLIPTALSFTPSPVIGGQTTTGKVVINGVAGPGGRTIAIFDNSEFSTVPSSVVVPAGANQVSFPITTLPVTSQKTVTVTARVTAGEKTGTFRINPAP
jgi:hypothetical protein